MKYEWLNKYKNLEIKELNNLKKDINYYLVMPKKYINIYETIKEKDIKKLKEEELLIILFYIVNNKKIKDNKLILIIEELLKIPDTNLPISDYTIEEMFEEIKNLKGNKPTSDKLSNNNIAACYNCMNIYYIDKIKYINKKDLCLCPYCQSTHIYFDNDYIPMNYNFLHLARMFYITKSLGSKFKDLQKIMKKTVIIEQTNNNKVDINIREGNDKIIDISELNNEILIRNVKKINTIEEQRISKSIYESLEYSYNNDCYQIRYYLNNINNLFTVLLSIMDYIADNPFIRKIYITCQEEETYKECNKVFKLITNYK